MSPLTVLILAVVPSVRAAEPAPLEFNRDIRPILSENCYYCHGQDANHREGKLRLDEFESATRDRGGYAAITPGNPDDSELIQRLLSNDEEERMPPAKSNKHVSPEQIALLRRWIAEGAVYQKHWAFTPPRRAPLPKVQAKDWPRQPIDSFVLARLEKEGLTPSPEARPETWLRRASLDLIGLPPTPAELDAFVADVARRGERAYGAAVDRLLGSPHFGERLAIDWLDAARYADTHGFNNDSSRTMWRWRDWVIASFNANLPYDRFITEQLAGDLLPAPTLDQRIATGFGRNHVINSEGGIIDEEYRVEYVADRVRTTSTAWLGLTLECAKCHDHKFDPIRQTDYYRMFAFFNNVPEFGEDGRVANAVPMIPAPTAEQQAQLAQQASALTKLDAQLNKLRTRWTWKETSRPQVEAALAQARTAVSALSRQPWLPNGAAPTGTFPGITEAAWRPDPAQPAAKIAPDQLDFTGKEGVSFSLWIRPDADNPTDVALISSLNHLGSPADTSWGKGRELRLIEGELELRLSERLPVYAIVVRTEGAGIRPESWHQVAVTYSGSKLASAVRIFVDGVEVPTRTVHDGMPGEPPKRDFLLGADNVKDGPRWRGTFDGAATYAKALDAAAVRSVFQSEALAYALADPTRLSPPPASSKPTSPVTGPISWVREALLADQASSRAAYTERAALWDQHLALRRARPTAMVMVELPQPRQAYVLTRGNYDAHGEAVTAGVPEELIAPWPKDAPHNRLGLARWLTQPQHPLTARVVVNRFWAQLFGTGLVKTLEDFGSQSEWPSHPELLDRLARDFVDGGWNVKALFRSLVLSSTYRQSSAAPAQSVSNGLIARDPENRLLARGPRLRLPAELLRDQALAVSGLLAPRLGGPSVYPYQPDKLYVGLVVGANYPGTQWPQGTGEDLYRRSLYTFWKRTVPHPAMITFDAPDREVCTVRRSRTNTPLQALALWNEPGYVEAARHLGTRMLREGGDTDDSRVAYGFRLATGRKPDATEVKVLTRTLARLRDDFAAHPDDATAFLKVGASPADASLSASDLAAAAAVASMILNLDETLTKS
ncbi:MAG: DUF1553 domain-containing protein [Opitutaceae bacterium]